MKEHYAQVIAEYITASAPQTGLPRKFSEIWQHWQQLELNLFGQYL